MKTIIILLIASTIASCAHRKSQNTNEGMMQKDPSDELTVIQVENAISSSKDIYRLSDIAERIEYIPLEFTPECAVGNRIFQMYIASDDIFILTAQSGSNDLFRFHKNGKFLNKIGKRGRGPGEYLDVLNFAIDTTKQHIYMNSNWQPNIIVYDYNGNYLHTIKKNYTSSNQLYYLPETNELAHVGLAMNFADPNTFFISVTDLENNNIFHKKFLVSSMITPSQWVNGGHETTFQSSNSLLLMDGMSDTLYSYSHGILNPYLVLNYGKYKMKLNAMLSYANNKQAFDNMIFTSIIAETSRYLFLKLAQGNGKQYLLRYDKHSREYTTFDVRKEGDNPVELIYNDVDGGLPVIGRAIPRYNQLSRIVDAFYMKETLTSEYFTKSEAIDTQAKERLKNLVHSLGDEDNPVIMKIILK